MFGRSSTPQEISRFYNELKAHCSARNTRTFDYAVEIYDVHTYPWYVYIGREALSFTDHYGAEMTQLEKEGKITLIREYDEDELNIGEFFRKTYCLADV